MIITVHVRSMNPHRNVYNMRLKPLERVQSFNDLEVTIQYNMQWDTKVNSMVRNLWFIKRTVGPLAPINAKRTFYLTLFRYILEYLLLSYMVTNHKAKYQASRVHTKMCHHICH